MADVLTKSQRSYNMSRIRSKDTTPEIGLVEALKKNGIKNFKTHSEVIGKPDLVFPSKKIVVFVDGCFWHKCRKCFVEPQSNRDFWLPKIEKNVERDRKVNRMLKKEGWKVIRVWEHDLRSEAGIQLVIGLLKNNLSARGSGRGCGDHYKCH